MDAEVVNGTVLSVDHQSSHQKIHLESINHIINDEEIQKVLNNKLYHPFLSGKIKKLIKALSEFELTQQQNGQRLTAVNENIKATLTQIDSNYKEHYRNLAHLVKEWESTRKEVIGELTLHLNTLDKYCKGSTLVRFIASSIDVSGSISGLIFRSQSACADTALKTASMFGLLGLISTLTEGIMSKGVLDKISELLERDVKLLEPIVQWFQDDTSEIDSNIQRLFPHGIDREMIKQIQAASAEQDNHLKVFTATLLSNVRQDMKLLHNDDFLHGIQLFASSKIASVWWNRIIQRRHPMELDVTRMELQIHCGQTQSVVYQSIQSLPLQQQNLRSLPVAGRIILNLLTMYDSFSDLRKGCKSMHSDKLRKHLEKMKSELKAVLDAVA